MIGLLILFWLFSASQYHKDCGLLLPEYKNIYSPIKWEFTTSDGRKIVQESPTFQNGSTTTEITNITMRQDKIGEERDEEAIEHNRKVRECQDDMNPPYHP